MRPEPAAPSSAMNAISNLPVDPPMPTGEQAEILVFTGNFHGRTTTIVGFSEDEPDWLVWAGVSIRMPR